MNSIEKINTASKLYIKKMILPSEPLSPKWNRENVLFSKPAKWNYIDGCMIKAVLMLYELYKSPELLRYAMQFTDAYISTDGNIPTADPLDFNLDNVNGGKNLITLYRLTGIETYKKAYDFIYEKQLSRQPRLKCGSFFHKAVYPYQIWLDGAYMALPFLAEYADCSHNPQLLDDVRMQIENIANIMRDSKTGLYFHAYDESRSMKWADSETGLSHEFWLRSMGWFCAALADLCEICGIDSESGRLYGNILAELLESLSHFAADDGMLLQLPARTDLDGNYPETSGTLLFAYSALKAERLGAVGKKLGNYGMQSLSAVTENYISVGSDGIPVLKNICLVAGLGGNPCRNGSPEYYLSEPVVENDAKGIAPFLMAFSELKHGTEY